MMGFSYSHSLRLAALALLTAVHACSSDSPTSPEAAQAAALSAVLNEVLLPAIDAVASPFLGSRLPVPPAGSRVPSDCAYDAASMSFVCPPVDYGWNTVNGSFTLYDGAGSRQAQFNSASTTAVQTATHDAGTLSYSGGTITVDYADERTVSGLGTSRHLLNGITVSTRDETFPSGGSSIALLSTVHTVGTTRIENLLLPSANNPWPGPGTVTYDDVTTVGTRAPVSAHLQVVFNGTRCVAISFTAGDYSQTGMIDLAKRGDLSVSDVESTCTP